MTFTLPKNLSTEEILMLPSHQRKGLFKKQKRAKLRIRKARTKEKIKQSRRK